MMNSEIEETEAFIRELDASLELELETVGDANVTAGEDAIFVIAHNGMSADMQGIDALYIIESALFDRAALIHVTWELKRPKEPKNVQIEFMLNAATTKQYRTKEVLKFRRNLADGDYCKCDADMGLVRLRGNQYLHQCGGVAENLVGTLGRNATSIISFLEGGESYADNDLTYDNSWNSW